MSDDVEVARANLMAHIGLVTSLRESVLINQLLKSFKASKRYQLDEEAVLEELREIVASSVVKSLKLEGTSGIQAANERRAAVQGGRDRVVAMNQELRTVLLSAQRVYRTGLVYVRSQPELDSLTAKATEDVALLVLSEVSEVVSTVERLLVETKEVLTNLDDRSRVIDSWFSLHKQYVFMTLNRGPGANEEKDSGSGKPFGSRHSRP